MSHILSGIFPAIISPFDAEGQLDTAALAANIKRWNQYGLRGYVACGSTGEAPLLTEEERAQVVRVVRETMYDGMALIVGTGRESTAQTIEACRTAAKSGADYGLVIAPSFFKSLITPEAMLRHYRAVADASPMPILVYNMPLFTGITIPADTVLALAEHPNIIGMKDSSGNGSYLNAIIRGKPADFLVLTGNAPTLAQAFLSGADGAILAIANLIPEICVAMHRATQAQNFAELQRLHKLMQPIAQVVGGSYGIGGLKQAMTLLGYHAGIPRPPLLPATEAQSATIEQTLKDVGLLR